MATIFHSRRIVSGEPSQPLRKRRWFIPMNAVSTIVALTLGMGVAPATPTDPGQAALDNAAAEVATAGNDLASLTEQLTEADAELIAVKGEVAGLKQQVNKALVDYSTAQNNATEMTAKLQEAKTALDEVSKKLVTQQKLLNEVSRTAYRRGGDNRLATLQGNSKLSDALAADGFLKVQATKQKEVVDTLAGLRVKKANETASVKAAEKKARVAEQEAAAAKDAAEAKLEEVTGALAAKQATVATLDAAKKAAAIRLEAAKANQTVLKNQAQEYKDYLQAKADERAAALRAAAAEKSVTTAQQQATWAAEDAQAAQQAAHEAVAAGAPDAAAKQETADRAVRASYVAEETASDLASKANEARKFVQGAAAALDIAADALTALRSFGAGSSDGSSQGSSRGSSRSVGSSRQAAPVAEKVTPKPQNPKIAAADKLLTGVAEKAEAAGVLADIVGGAVDEPPAPEGTQAALVQRSQRANPGERYSLLQLYRGFDTVTPADLGLVTADSITAFNGTRSEKIEAVIARAKSYLGTPYAWGGGNAAGPTRGIRDGGVADSYGDYNKVGFDCSGLVLYAFAGVGVALPHYTGYQYQRGTKIPISQIQRGDLLFWGPNAEYHVAIYLGNGQMIEAPESGSHVKISPVRYSGMSPYAVRLV